MPTPDLEQVKKALAAMFQPGDTVELRCVSAGDKTINGYYRDLSKLAQDACRLNGEFTPQQNCYVCLNPVDPQLFARRADQFAAAKKGEGTKDSEILICRWLLIDVDPIRPTGVSATSKLRAAAIETAKQVYRYLQELGFPMPVVGDSGNGQHLLLRLADLPNNDETTWACKQFLTHLHGRFSNEQVKVDETTFNAARICALYGTVKRKGSDLPEQPHRLSKLLHVPDPLQAVSLGQLLAVVGPQPPQPVVQQQSIGSGWNIPQLLEQQAIEYEADDNYQTSSGERATRYTLEVCPFNEQHNDRSAVLLQWTNGALAFRCHHDGCTGKDWQALKALWQLNGSAGITAADIILPAVQPQAGPQPLLIVRSLDVQPEAVGWLWEDRLVIGGINLFAGRGGIGKTYMVCDLVARITNAGLVAPNGQPLRHGRVLYSTGEDHVAKVIEPRMQLHGVDRSRLEYIKGQPVGAHVHLLDVVQHCDLLDTALRQRPDTVALVLDPVSAFQGDADSNKVAAVRRFTGVLAALAETHNIAIIAIHHFSKGRREMAGDAISGSHAYRDASRAVWLFALDVNDPTRRLMVSDKHNWAASCPPGLAYRIELGVIRYEAVPLEMTSDELMAQGTEQQLDIACAWLLAQLSTGPQQAANLQIAATLENISERTLTRAKKRLAVQSHKDKGHWIWTLPGSLPDQGCQNRGKDA